MKERDIPIYQPKGLVEMIKTPHIVRRRLESSRSSGHYYFFVPDGRIGINRAPHNPVFEVVSSKFFRIKIFREMLDQLEMTEVRGIEFPVPHSKKNEIEKFVDSFESPKALYIGNFAVTSKMLSTDLHRFNEIFIFDLTNTEDMYEKRRVWFNTLKKNTDSTGEEIKQGSLTAKFGVIEYDNEEKAMPIINKLEERNGVKIFNHFAVFGMPVRVLPFGGQRYVYNHNDEPVVVTIYSYDHETVKAELWRDEAMIFYHPIPKKTRPD